MNDERQAILLERLQEDEHLLGDLEDPAATALLAWASARVQAATDPNRPDEAVAADVQAIRQAARAAAQSGEQDPQRVVAWATAALQPMQPTANAQPQPAVPLQPAQPDANMQSQPTLASRAAARLRTFFRRLRAPRNEPRFRWRRPGKDS